MTKLGIYPNRNPVLTFQGGVFYCLCMIAQPTSEQHRKIICLQQNGMARNDAFEKIMGFKASELAAKEADDLAKDAEVQADVANKEAEAKTKVAEEKKVEAEAIRKKAPAKKAPAKKAPAKKASKTPEGDWE